MTESYTTRPTSASPYQGSESFYKKLAKPVVAGLAALALYFGSGNAYAQDAQPAPVKQEQKAAQEPKPADLAVPQQTHPQQPVKDPAPQAADLAAPAQTQVRKQGDLHLPDASRLYNELTITSYKSLQQRADELSLRTPILDIYTQGFSARERELLSDDRINERGFGGYAELKLLGLNAGVNYSNGTRTRKSHSSDVTEDANFRITTVTDADEVVESDYLAGNARVSFGLDENPANQLTLGLAGYRANDNVKVDSTTLVDVFSKIGTGNYQQIISGGDSFDVTTTGLKGSIQREWERLTIGSNMSMARTEIGSDSSTIDVYVPVEVFMRLYGVDSRWALAGAIGRRLIDNSEEHSRWDNFHGYANAAYHADNGVTAFATFAQLDQPRAGGGLIIGEGNPVRMLMDYQDEFAWNELGRMEHMGPHERSAYLHALQYDFIRGLAADNTLRLLLFGGARRNEVAGEHQWDWFGQAALAIPLITEKGNEFTVVPYFRRESNGLESIIEAGIQFEPADGWRFNLKGGVVELEGRKHERGEYLGIGIEKGF